MQQLRVSRATLGSPVWTCAQVGDTVYVNIDHDYPGDDAAVEVCVRTMMDAGVDVVSCVDAPVVSLPADSDSGERPAGR